MSWMDTLEGFRQRDMMVCTDSDSPCLGAMYDHRFVCQECGAPFVLTCAAGDWVYKVNGVRTASGRYDFSRRAYLCSYRCFRAYGKKAEAARTNSRKRAYHAPSRK